MKEARNTEAAQTMWNKWWQTIKREDKRKIVTSAHPVNKEMKFNPHNRHR